ncbi:MAG: hypothetical protein ACREI8_12140, partial [Myxococcota bacterium]
MRRSMAALPPLAVAALYARSAGFEFVWDDWYLVVNPTFEYLDVWAIGGSAGHGLHYLPAGHLTLLFDTWAHGSWAGGFHLTSVVLFAAAAFLVRVFFQNLFERSGDPATEGQARELALTCALVFCVHPLQVEPVAFVANRGGLVALLCWVGTLLLYAAFLARPVWTLYVGTIVLTLSGLLSKATSIALPLVLFLFHMHRAPAERPRRIALLLAPHFLLSAGFAFAHVAVARGVGVMEAKDPIGLLQRIPRALFTIEFYVWKFLWPTGLTIDYDLSALRANWLSLVLGGALLFSGFVCVVLRGQRRRTLPWFLAWSYLVALVPVMNLLPTSPLVADRYAQLPLVVLCPLLVAPLLVRLPVQSRRVLAVLVITALGAMSVHQLSSWRDDEALQRQVLANNPESSKALHNISMVLWDRGRREEALRVAIELQRIH